VNTDIQLPSPRAARAARIQAFMADRGVRLARAAEAQRAEDLRYRDLLAAEVERALSGQSPTRWAGRRGAPRGRFPLALLDYPVRANGGALVVRSEALPDLFGDCRFAANGLRVARLVAADGRSWTEVSELPRKS
jgi:hypothetical protein